MNIYKLLQINQKINNHRIKFFGLWLLSIFNKRYLSIQFDPVLACNLRCKMCYFTDPNFTKKLKGIFKEEDLPKIASVNFKNALKIQIGCGAEPTLFKNIDKIIELACQYKIPHISMVTNGNLLTKQDISTYSEKGLHEFIISMHGVYKDTYENFMDKGNYDIFHKVLENISLEKKNNPKLSLRINYTFNKDNFYEIKDFFKWFGQYDINTIQFRPIDKIGETAYNNFSLKEIEQDYSKIMQVFGVEAQLRKINVLAPTSIKRDEEHNVVQNKNNSSYLVPYATCYIAPDFFWKENFDWKNQTFHQWKKENHWDWKLFKNIFISRKKLDQINRNMLNYSVEMNG